MQDVAFPKGTDGWSRHQATTLLRAVAGMFQSADIPALADLFTEDCVVRYCATPEQQGRVMLRRVLTAHLSRRQNLRAQKCCVAIDQNKLVIRSEEAWTERETGKAMIGLGVEVWTMRAGKIAMWEAAFAAGEDGALQLAAAVNGGAPLQATA